MFSRFGRYDEEFDACEDVEFNHRLADAGIRGYISPYLAVNYRPRDSFGGLFRQMIRYGRGRLRLVCKHPRALTVGQFVPVAFVVLSLLLGWAAVWTWWGKWALLVLGGTYIGAIICFSMAIAVSQGWRYLKQLPLIFPTIHVGLALGTLMEAADVVRYKGRQIFLGKPRVDHLPGKSNGADSDSSNAGDLSKHVAKARTD